MDVMLLKDVEHLGRAGQIVKVDDDLARSYLFRGQLAVAAERAAGLGLAAFGLYPGLEPLNGKDLGESVDSVNMLDLYYGLESEGPNSTLLRRATELFGDSKAAIEWLNEEIPSLGGRKPLDLFAGSEEDKERVYTILGRIEAGVF